MFRKFCFFILFVIPSCIFAYPFSEIKNLLPDNPNILDCGAHKGNSSTMLLNQFPNATVIAVEADPKYFGELQERAKDNPSILPFHYALGTLDGEIEFYLADEKSHYSTIGSIYKQTKSKEFWSSENDILKEDPIIVPSIRLDTLCDMYNFPSIDFMYLDMQGSELGMLKNCPTTLSNTKVIITEVLFKEMYEGAPLYDKLKSFLEENGFILKELYRRTELWGDALFIRR